MSRVEAGGMQSERSGSRRPGWAATWKERLHPYRPRYRERRFWAVQGLVVLVAAIHTLAEAFEVLGHEGGFQPLYFVPSALFFIPVVYAALNFGLAGSLTTALWSTILTTPNWVLFHAGWDRAGCMFQVGMVDAMALFVGQRVEREMAARRKAEAAGAALRASEARYRGLFESSPVAVLLLDATGVVIEANPAASSLFEKPLERVHGVRMAELLGSDSVQHILDASADSRPRTAYLLHRAREGPDVYVEPALTRIGDDQGGAVIQVLLKDVTQERQRQAGLRAYAAHIVRAQEEERRRIAQELHDEAIQELVMLCRRLDAIEVGTPPLPASAVQELRAARRSTEGVVRGLRDFAGALRPPTLEDLGFVTSIRRLVADLVERTQMAGHLSSVGEERRLPAEVELGLFRIAQEALRNVERHAHATHVSVAIAFDEGETRLEVRDDGAGFVVPPSPADLAARGQLGLLGMQERAELLGGRLELHSEPGQGTRVAVSMPLGEEALSGAALAVHGP